jgi:transglutaminase-like putative cysteine protease
VAGEGPLALRILTFTALLLFCGAHWIGFVADPPIGRLLAVVLIAAVAGCGLALTGLVPGGLPARIAARIALLTGALALGLLAMGLDDRYLVDWPDLVANVDAGLAGTTSADWPYGGDDPWLRLTVLLGLPVVAVAATALAFWPARRAAGALRAAALVLLMALYALAATERGLGDPIGRGLALLLLVAAWLWLPRLRVRDATAAAAALLVAGLVALPVAAGLRERDGWFDYENWALFGDDGRGPGSTFDWSHSYGPIDWPRDGKTLLRVRAARPHYWKAQTLDYFDGLRWAHSTATQNQAAQAEVPRDRNPAWDERLGFRVEGLSSRLLVGAGTMLYVRGGDALTSESGDGTIALVDGDLERGDVYELLAYVPKPTPRQMRAAPAEWTPQFAYYTTFQLPVPGQRPNGGQVVPDRDRLIGTFEVGRPLGDDPATRAQLDASPYRRTYELARRLAAGQPTTYDVVRRIEQHFERGFTYTESPPQRDIPLDGFLFRDRAGYCQQFSGAMALMLRMNGIPARVAAGFSPGLRDPKTREYRVRDLDAHSWVEVYFTGIGWVAFDPTPSQAPASAQESDSPERRSDAAGGGGGDAGGGSEQADGGAGAGGGAGDGGHPVPWAAAGLILLLPLALVGGLWLTALLRARRVRSSGGDPDLRELVWALGRLGHPVGEGTTLLELERRRGRIAGPGAARHVRSLRERRYAPPGAVHAIGLDRRALRRGLARGRGPAARLRALMALPPRRLTSGRG